MLGPCELFAADAKGDEDEGGTGSDDGRRRAGGGARHKDCGAGRRVRPIFLPLALVFRGNLYLCV